jgi:hypothetical protein
MRDKVSIKLGCPKCGFPVNASIEEYCHEFLLFVCPKCQSNVVFYDNKLDIISNKMLSKLIRKDKLKQCGILNVNVSLKTEEPISLDDVVNLKIALQTSKGVDDFLQKI